MGYWAKVITEGNEQKVVDVIVADAEFFDDFIDTTPGTWIETFIEDEDNPRKDYASIGGTYRKDLDAFIPKKDDGKTSWVLDETTCRWKAPTPPGPKPTDGKYYRWNEELYQAALLDSSDVSVAWQLKSGAVQPE